MGPCSRVVALDLRRLRESVDALRERISPLPSPIAVVPHDRADFDAIGSALGMSWYLNQNGFDARIFAPSVSSSVARTLDKLDVTLATDLGDLPVLLVDTHSSNMLPPGVPADSVVLAVDHHKSGDLPAVTFPCAASLSQIVGYLALSQGKDLPHPVAVALSLGIFHDTHGLSAADPAALLVLSELLDMLGTDVSELRFSYESQSPVSLRIALLRSAERQRIYVCGDYIVVVSHVSSFEGMAASFLLGAGADAVFVYATDRMSVRFSRRLLDLGISASTVLEHVVRQVGGAWGGHDAAAGWAGSDPKTAARVAAEFTLDLLSRRAGCLPRQIG